MPNYTEDVITTKKFITGESLQSDQKKILVGEICFNPGAGNPDWTGMSGETVTDSISIWNYKSHLQILGNAKTKSKCFMDISVDEDQLNLNHTNFMNRDELISKDLPLAFKPSISFNSKTSSITVGGNVSIGGNDRDGILWIKDAKNTNSVSIEGFDGGSIKIGNNLSMNNYMLSFKGHFSLAGDNVIIDESSKNLGFGNVKIDGKSNTISLGNVTLDGNQGIHHFGNVKIDGIAGDVVLLNADCAEDFEISSAEKVDPGTVMALNDDGKLVQGKQPYDKRVVGVISGAGDLKPGLILGRQPGKKEMLPLALMGRVNCKVDAEYDQVEVGDLLTTSETLGHAMKASDPTRSFGTVIGKALKSLKGGQDLIPILVALQ
jgi:hypothetical protein